MSFFNRAYEDEFTSIVQGQLTLSSCIMSNSDKEHVISKCSIIINSSHLCDNVADMAGILVPKFNLAESALTEENPDSRIIFTQTTLRNMNKIAVAISLEMPILIEGCPGAGKTSLIEEAARMTGQKGSYFRL